ncbi:GTPase Der [termite gut metagenome]|uniref:GTPase Der n=1 Tax=termite gut metagenome TaxID=433724 RepID=A0A5J4RUZ5_9ZZZZ
MANWFRKLFGRTKSSPIQTTQAEVDVKTRELEALNKEKDAGIERLRKEIEIERLKREIAEVKANLKSAPEKPEAEVDFQPPVSDEYLDSLRSQLTEKETLIKTLKKELADKEDEIDDKKFDLNAAKKKLDESKKENSELKNSLRDIENEYTAKSQELDKVKAEAKEIEEELGIKKQSLGFVGEILNAKEADSRDAIEIKEKTEAVIQFVENNVCDIFRETSSLETKDYKELCEDIWKWGNFERKTWLKGKTVVAFVGEFSAGKTSIVNRILSQDKEDTKFTLPVSSAPTTAIATYISAGHETSVQFTDSDENLKNMRLKTFMEFSKASLDKINLSKLVRHFVVKYNNQHLNNLSILDTPGFSSNDHEDEIRTTKVVKEADALFWVVDAHTGEVNDRSVQIIKKHLEGISLFIVINKVDGKSPNERDQIKRKVQQTMEKNGIQVRQYIEFSKKEPLNTMMNVISTILPRKQDNNILDEIKGFSDKLIKEYEEEITSAQKEIRDYQTQINEAESIIDTNPKEKDIRIEEWNNNLDRMGELIGNTFFGSGGNKIKDPERYWELDARKAEIFNEVMDLYSEFADARENWQINTQNKLECEQNVKELRKYIQDIKQLNSKFNELTKPFN